MTEWYDSAQRPPPMLEELREAWQYRDLLAQLIARNLKVRYKRSVLGLAWTMLNPLMMMTILTVVFANLFRVAIEHYAVYFLAAFVLWSFFSQATLTAMTDLVWGGNLLQRIYVPRTVFALAAVGTGLVNLLFALVPLAIIMLATGVPFQATLLFLPVPIALTGLFALGVGLGMSALAITFTDAVDIYQVVLTAWLYLTPVIYPLEVVPESLRWLFHLNPMYYFVESFRRPIYAGVLPSPLIVLAALVIALTSLIAGWWIFARNADALAYRI